MMDVPLSLTLSYRYQQISLDDGALTFDETVQQASLGLSYVIRDVF